LISSGIRRSNDQDRVGPLTHEHGLDGGQHPSRLLRLAAPADPERVVRPWQAELREERPGHGLVVMLAGVDEDLVVATPQRREERRGLDQLGTRPDDADDPQGRLPAPVPTP